MSEMYAEAIGVNRYAPSDCATVSLYGYNGAEGLTLAQAINAMVVRRAAVLERSATAFMNQLVDSTNAMEDISGCIDDVIVATGWTDELKKRVIDVGVKESSLPETLDSYKRRMEVFDLLKNVLTERNASVDRTAIELQTAISRRDTTYKLATTTCTAILRSVENVANTFI